jgi:secreted trypsin-like serine protease
MPDDRDQAPGGELLSDHLDAVETLARLVARDDDQEFVLVFQSLVNVVDPYLTRPEGTGMEQARAILERTADALVTRGQTGLRQIPPALQGDARSVYDDPTYIENAVELITNRARIIGGRPTPDFPDCVAVGSDLGWCCSGTLVAPNVVVTAGHCVRGGCGSRVFLGPDVNDPANGEILEVVWAEAHPDYNPPDPTSDLAVLILSDDASSTPRVIAHDGMLESAGSVRVAGFGNTNKLGTRGYGKRRMVDVPIATPDPQYGADPNTEFVAGAPFLDRDSCNGDSGGPAYVQDGEGWYVAGATSRATNSTVRPCGDGGIYTRIHSFEGWVRSVRGSHWA